MFNPMAMMANNPIFRVLQMAQASNNPMQLLQQQLGNNPQFNQAMQMVNGKNEDEIKDTFRNLARQKGMTDEQMAQFVSQFGLKL